MKEIWETAVEKKSKWVLYVNLIPPDISKTIFVYFIDLIFHANRATGHLLLCFTINGRTKIIPKIYSVHLTIWMKIAHLYVFYNISVWLNTINHSARGCQKLFYVIFILQMGALLVCFKSNFEMSRARDPCYLGDIIRETGKWQKLKKI